MGIDKKAAFQEIEAVAESRGMSLTALAEATGLGTDTLTKARQRGRAPSLETIEKLQEFLNIGIGNISSRPIGGEVRIAKERKIAAPKAKDLPVMGTAAGALANNGFEISSQIIEHVHRPPALDGVPDAYAIYVVGESMIPEHHPRDLRIVHPFRAYRPGDSIIILLRAHEGAKLEGYIKIFVSETASELIAAQHNPKAEITYSKKTVVSVHKVMSLNELF